MSETLLIRVREIVANTIGEPVDNMTETTSPGDVEGWDSFAQLNIMVALEDEFSIHLTPDDIPIMENIGAIVDLVRSRSG